MLNASQIIDQANQISKTIGYTSQAGRALNYILNGLANNYDFAVLRKTANPSIGSSSYSLPTDYLRMRELFYNINGAIHIPNQVPLKDYDAEFQGTGIASYPYEYATDINTSPVTLYLYPPPSGSFQFTIRYNSIPADIVTPETSTSVPWFQYTEYLIHSVATEMMKLSDDTRWTQFEEMKLKMLRDYLKMVNDQENYTNTVQKDGRFWKSGRSAKPTKGFY